MGLLETIAHRVSWAQIKLPRHNLRKRVRLPLFLAVDSPQTRTSKKRQKVFG